MKKNHVICIFVGALLFCLGAYEMYQESASWMPLLLFLGGTMIAVPTGFFEGIWREEFSAKFPIPYKPIPHESLFLARMFIALSYIARHEGILALEEAMCDKTYTNVIYRMGKDMIINGIDPDFVRENMENSMRLMCERLNTKIRYLKQIGLSFIFVGLFAGLAGGAAYAIRYLDNSIAVYEGLYVLILGVVVLLMMGALFSLLIPCKIYNAEKHSQRIKRQIILGILALQSGDSYYAILRTQYTFLSCEEASMMLENPLPLDFKDNDKIKDYDEVAQLVRKEILNYTAS